MKQIVFVMLLMLRLSESYSQTSWVVKSAQFTFLVKNAGLSVKGTVEGFDGQVNFDSKQITSSTIKGTVKVNTLKTGIAARDKHLQEKEYFDTNKYPLMNISSSFFGKTSNGFKAYCRLTIKGVTKDIVIPFNWIEQENNAVLSGEFDLNRLDYQLGEKSLILSDKVTVYINLNLVK